MNVSGSITGLFWKNSVGSIKVDSHLFICQRKTNLLAIDNYIYLLIASTIIKKWFFLLVFRSVTSVESLLLCKNIDFMQFKANKRDS